ncbi:hypothetical protein [Deinococcus sp.]|uniref:hypothetical protein n=1 Tax=Deinococcus sp. TaxID=47478 RepID=UPI003B593048
MSLNFRKVAAILALACLPFAAAQTARPKLAPETYFGLNTLGGQVTYDTGRYALRLGVGGRTVLFVFANGVGADAAVLFPITGTRDTPSRFSLGAGLDANAYFATLLDNPNGSGVYVLRPHVLAQYETRLSQRVTFFTEGSLGYAFSFNDGGIVYPGIKLGINFR